MLLVQYLVLMPLHSLLPPLLEMLFHWKTWVLYTIFWALNVERTLLVLFCLRENIFWIYWTIQICPIVNLLQILWPIQQNSLLLTLLLWKILHCTKVLLEVYNIFCLQDPICHSLSTGYVNICMALVTHTGKQWKEFEIPKTYYWLWITYLCFGLTFFGNFHWCGLDRLP